MFSEQEQLMEQVNLAKPREAARLVFEAARSFSIDLNDFIELLPFIDEECGCEICGGAEGGTPGNENVIDGTIVCDFCVAKRHKALNQEIKVK